MIKLITTVGGSKVYRIGYHKPQAPLNLFRVESPLGSYLIKIETKDLVTITKEEELAKYLI